MPYFQEDTKPTTKKKQSESALFNNKTAVF